MTTIQLPCIVQLEYKDNLLKTIVNLLVKNFVGWPRLEKSHCKLKKTYILYYHFPKEDLQRQYS